MSSKAAQPSRLCQQHLAFGTVRIAEEDTGDPGDVVHNAAAEEVFFRGALYAAIGTKHPVAVSTAIYSLATIPTRNLALVLTSAVMERCSACSGRPPAAFRHRC